MRKFKGSPSQQAVIRLLLTRGFSVNDTGRVVSGAIEIPHTQIAGELGIDRRVVDSTTNTILQDVELKPIFQNENPDVVHHDIPHPNRTYHFIQQIFLLSHNYYYFIQHIF